jgi:hypothetical protein
MAAVTPGASGAMGAALAFSERANRRKPEIITASIARMRFSLYFSWLHQG